MIDLKQSIQYIKGVGPSRVKILNYLGLYKLEDVIEYYPRAYEDRTKIKQIADMEDGEEGLISVTAVTSVTVMRLKRNMTMSRAIVRDDSDSCLVTWFNQPYIKDSIKAGESYKLYGRISRKNGKIEMNTPVFDRDGEQKNTGKIIPIYPTTKTLNENTLRRIIQNSLEMVNGKLEEDIPQYIIKEYQLQNINEAIQQIHFPDSFENMKKARTRFVFEELLSLQLALLKLKNQYNSEIRGINYSKNVKMSDVINVLPFNLTKAQIKVLEEIDKDMESTKPMNRLLQGDVGSGKTVVAMIAAYKAVKSGYQVAVMAPTTILAMQHIENFNSVLNKFGIKCEVLVSNISPKRKAELLERLKTGDIDILIGTHALIQENVEFSKLGLVITDEQHRFGVKQRSIIEGKGKNPDVLVMTATPIPRTLAIILYGDLDISIIDELPPNRKKIETIAVKPEMTDRINEFIKKNINEGRQCYIVCPFVEENEEMDIKAVETSFEKYKTEVFTNYKVEMLHGKMKQKDKDRVMQDFKDGNVDVLVSTTVIEVGVDVPNANIMLVENAERFGLAQLHQLRGRVGRGEYQSYCVLKYNSKSEVVTERMKIMTKTDDGFKIAEKDLELRGSGEFFGTKQHGLPEFKIANLFEDMPILKQVQELAIKIEQNDPKLEKEENKELTKLVNKLTKERIEI